MEISSKYNLSIDCKADLFDENLNNFNDMGAVQALDNITALLRVIAILYNNRYKFNAKKIIIYDHSYGAYLAYLYNVFAPTVFSLIIDNSDWIYPMYLKNDRQTFASMKNYILNIKLEYLAKKLDIDKEMLYLPYL
ncbi:protein of unknown function [Tepidibacter aestuarii]|nr:protein of unknown function [Tepidibacter aestuarii]